jgi:hypothetical protein
MRRSKRQLKQSKAEEHKRLKAAHKKAAEKAQAARIAEAEKRLKEKQLKPKTRKTKEQKKAYRKNRARQNREKKERERKLQKLLANKRDALNAGNSFIWHDIPEHITNLVEYNDIPKKLAKMVNEAAQHAKKASYKLVGLLSIKYKSELYDELGEISEFKDEVHLWHGTKLYCLRGILTAGFRLPARGGMLGRGVYTAPSFAKAWNYTDWGRHQTKVVLLCSCRLGKIYKVKNTGWQNAELAAQNAGCHTAYCGAGRYKKAWRGYLMRSEYCIYDPIQVKPQLLLAFQQ